MSDLSGRGGVVIAIDGPAGAGKSTLARGVAARLELRYLDTGAMYRCLGLIALERRIGFDDEASLAAELDRAEIDFGPGLPPTVLIGARDVSVLIRKAEVAEAASIVSVHASVRRTMVAQQRAIVSRGGVVLEGRDATTVIAPNATLKIYLTASLEERARRRAEELDVPIAFADVREQIQERDYRDITRKESPLRVAEGAVVIESGGKSPESLVTEIVALVNR